MHTTPHHMKLSLQWLSRLHGEFYARIMDRIRQQVAILGEEKRRLATFPGSPVSVTLDPSGSCVQVSSLQTPVTFPDIRIHHIRDIQFAGEALRAFAEECDRLASLQEVLSCQGIPSERCESGKLLVYMSVTLVPVLDEEEGGLRLVGENMDTLCETLLLLGIDSGGQVEWITMEDVSLAVPPVLTKASPDTLGERLRRLNKLLNPVSAETIDLRALAEFLEVEK